MASSGNLHLSSKKKRLLLGCMNYYFRTTETFRNNFVNQNVIASPISGRLGEKD